MKSLTIKTLVTLFALLASAQVAQAEIQAFVNKNFEYVMVESTDISPTSPTTVQNYKASVDVLKKDGYTEGAFAQLQSDNQIKDDVWCKVSVTSFAGYYSIECYPANTQGFGVTIETKALNVADIPTKLVTARAQQRAATKFLKLPK